jgi:hypothetical protein
MKNSEQPYAPEAYPNPSLDYDRGIESGADILELIAKLRSFVDLKDTTNFTSLESLWAFLAEHGIVEAIVEAVHLKAEEGSPDAPEEDRNYPLYMMIAESFMAVIDHSSNALDAGLILRMCNIEVDPTDGQEGDIHYGVEVPIPNKDRVDTGELASTGWSAQVSIINGGRKVTLYNYNSRSSFPKERDPKHFVGILQVAVANLVSVLDNSAENSLILAEAVRHLKSMVCS